MSQQYQKVYNVKGEPIQETPNYPPGTYVSSYPAPGTYPVHYEKGTWDKIKDKFSEWAYSLGESAERSEYEAGKLGERIKEGWSAGKKEGELENEQLAAEKEEQLVNQQNAPGYGSGYVPQYVPKS